MEGDNFLESYFSYAIVVRSPIKEIEKLREYVQEMRETRIVVENLSTHNQWITDQKPPNRMLPNVIEKEE
jgi:hypothetical protein